MSDVSKTDGRLFRDKRLEMALKVGPFVVLALSLFWLGIGLESHYDKLGSESEHEIFGMVGSLFGLVGIYLNILRIEAAAFKKRLVDLERRMVVIEDGGNPNKAESR